MIPDMKMANVKSTFGKLIILTLGSAWAPGAWVVALQFGAPDFDGELFTEYLVDWIILPLTFTWASGFVTASSLWCAGRRFGGLIATLFGLISIPFPMAIIFVYSVLSSGFCPFEPSCSPDRIPASHMMWLATFIVALSLPAWLTLGVAVGWKAIRARGEDATT